MSLDIEMEIQNPWKCEIEHVVCQKRFFGQIQFNPKAGEFLFSLKVRKEGQLLLCAVTQLLQSFMPALSIKWNKVTKLTVTENEFFL